MLEIGDEHQELLQFLYAVPVGLVHASGDGTIELINSASAGWLMPLAPDGRLDNLFTVLSRVLPGLRHTVAQRGPAPGVIVDHLRLELTGGRHSAPEFIALTLTRLDDGRLMAVFDDVTQQVRDERALDASEAHYRAVVSVLSEGVVLHDAAGRLLMCNTAAERIVGAPLPALLAADATDLPWTPMWPDRRPMAVADTPTGIVLAGGPEQDRVPVFSVSPAGEERWFEVSARPVLRPGSGELLAVVTSFTDVTQRQQLQEELRHHREHLQELVDQRTRELEGSNAALSAQQRLLRSIADAVPGLIGYWDADLRCRFSNRAYLEWFGLDDEAMDGIRMPDALGAELFEQDRPHVEAALRGQAQHFQRSIRKPDGSLGHTLASYIPDVSGGRVRGFNVVVSDVTELKQAELRLAEANEQLRQRAVQADEASRAKSAFLANMSHEIRTPMNAIIGLAHLMRRDAQNPLEQARLRKIDDASRHLLQLINDILDLSKIEAGKMTLDDAEFAMQDVLSRSLDLVAAQAREKGLELGVDCDSLPRRLRGDAVRLSQCLINLLSNAVKFTERGWVRLRGRAESGDALRVLLRFEVQDSGPGIPPARQAALFTAFEQADNSPTRRHGGTGLGLALTRHVARLMGGDAGVRSQPGEGSTFWFTASMVRVDEGADDGPWAPPGTPSAEAGPHSGLAGRRVLLVEDNPVNQEVAVELLEDAGLVVDVAGDGAQAVERVRARHYDAVLMDVQMPVMDGMEATRRIRASGSRVPIIAMTANAFAEERAACLAAGMNHHVAKPVNPEVLYAALSHWLAPAALPPDAGATTLVGRLGAVPGLDVATALRAVGGQVGTLERVLRRFVVTYGSDEGQPAFGRGELAVERLASLSHSLRGACGAIGATALHDALADFERALRTSQDADAHAPRARALDRQLGQLVESLRSALGG